MNDIDHVDILIKLVFEIAFEKVEISDIEKPIFQGGLLKINPPPPGTVRVNPIGPGKIFGTCVLGRGVFSPPLKSNFLLKKSIIFGPEINLIYFQLYFENVVNFQLDFDNYSILELKITKNHNFCENKPTNTLYTSKES